MLCNCSRVRFEKCKSRVLSSGFQPNVTSSGRMILAQNKRVCCAHAAMRPKRSIFVQLFECVYERCAGYNLRYCPIRRFRKKNCGGEALRDVLLLLCFLLANFVVFLTIFARMTLHMAAVLLQSAGWLRRSLQTKVLEHKQSLDVTNVSTQQSHNFSPPHKIF